MRPRARNDRPRARRGPRRPPLTGNTGHTNVTIQVENKDGQEGKEEQLSFTVPTVIPFAAKADGTLVGPTASKTQIVNNSVFSIHVAKMAVSTGGTGWNLVADASKADGTNALSFELSADPTAAAVSAASAVANPVDLSKDAHWEMSYEGSGKNTVDITSTGKVAHVTKDLHDAQKAATITWTLAAGSAQ